MCGRFAITLPPEAMRRLFGYVEQPNFPPRYNIAPTQPIPIVRTAVVDGAVERHFALVRWGFLPGFVQDPKGFPLLFNARAEGLTEKASFRNAVRRRRCVVPADAFYEWQRAGGTPSTRAAPFVCRRVDATTMALAALWESWCGPNGEELDTACIITTRANAVSAAIHPRLPVVIELADLSTWLDPDERACGAAIALLRSPGDRVLQFTPIGDGVNKAANDSAEIMRPTGAPLVAPGTEGPGKTQPDLFEGGRS